MENSTMKTKLLKTGVKILSSDDDFTEVFTGKKTCEPSFADMVEKSLSEKDISSLLKDKAGNDKPKQRISEKIKTYPPQAEIDLHGCTALEAEEETKVFIRRALNSGFKAVKIIVGKGIHSAGRPVVKEVVERAVVACKKEKTVSTFIWEKESKTKSGAVIVYLP